MAECLYFTGAESADGLEVLELDSVTVDAAVKRSGSRSFKVHQAVNQNNTSAVLLGVLDAAGALTTFSHAALWLTFYVYIDPDTTIPAGSEQCVFQSKDIMGYPNWELRLTSDFKLKAYAGYGAAVATSTAILQEGQFYRIDFLASKGNAASYELRVNGVSDFSGQADTGFNYNIGYVRLGIAIHRDWAAGHAYTLFLDDIAVFDAGWPDDDIRVGAPAVIGNGSLGQWTGTYVDYDERPHDGDTSFAYTAIAGRAELAAGQSCAAAGMDVGTIHAVKALAVQRWVTGSGSPTTQVLMYRAGASLATTGAYVGTAYVARQKLSLVAPGSAEWTEALVDATEPGIATINNMLGETARCTSLQLHVLYSEPAGEVLDGEAAISGAADIGGAATLGRIGSAPLAAAGDLKSAGIATLAAESSLSGSGESPAAASIHRLASTLAAGLGELLGVPALALGGVGSATGLGLALSAGSVVGIVAGAGLLTGLGRLRAGFESPPLALHSGSVAVAPVHAATRGIRAANGASRGPRRRTLS